MPSKIRVTNQRPEQGRIFILWLSYTIVAILLTWPTITQLTTHLPGDGGDDPAIAWNLWWIKQALLVEGQNPFVTDYMFYPLGINLAFYTLTVLNGVTALPLTLNFGVVAASNLHMFFTFVVGGYGAFLLTRYVLQQTMSDHPQQVLWLSAALAGGIYAFASSKLFYIALGQFNIGSSHWIPLTVLYIVRTHQQPDRSKNLLMAGIFFTFQAWAELTYASFILVFLGLFWAYHGIMAFVVRRVGSTSTTTGQIFSGSKGSARHVRAGVGMLLIFLVGLGPILAQMIPDMLTEGDFLVEGGGFAGAFSADLWGFLIPTMHHPIFGDLVRQTGITDFNVGQHIYLGLIGIGLSAVSLRLSFRRPGLRFWLVSGLFFALLALGPIITVNGVKSGLPGPFTILQQLPFFKGNRYPSRYSVMLLLSISVLAGFSLTWLSLWLKRRFRIAPTLTLLLITGLYVFEHLSLPLPQSNMRIPVAYGLIDSNPDEVVLDIPFAWRNGFRITGALTTQFMFGQFYQTGHQRRLLQGNTSRNPALKFQYFTQAPVISSLLALETGYTLPQSQLEADRTIAADVLRFFNIRHIVIRPYQYPRFDGAIVDEQATKAYVEAIFLVKKIHDGSEMTLYRVQENSQSATRHRIETDSPLAPLYFGQGWGLINSGQPITAQRKRVRLLLPPGTALRHLTLKIRLPNEFQTDAQTVRLEVDGWQSEPQSVGDAWAEITFDLPPLITEQALKNVWLHFDQLITFAPVTGHTQDLVDLTVISAGEQVGGFGHIFVNGHDISSNRRGYNIFIKGQAVQNFDTHLTAAASAELTQVLANAPADRLLALVVADEASRELSEAAVQAIQQITGSTQDLRGCFRCSQAIIREADGTLREALSPTQPVGLTTGLGLTEPGVAALVEWIEVK